MFKSVWREKDGMKKGPWTPEEDQKLSAYIEAHGHGSWSALPAKAGLSRCGKSCRLRWNNYLRQDIKRGKFSLQEEQSIIQLHALLGNRWSAIASHLPKRTDNEIKNYWNTHLRKRLHKVGIDPVTHKPKVDVFGSSSGHSKDAANLSHLAQWERTRLEAEARLVRESKLVSNSLQNQVGSSAITKVVAPAPARPQCLDVLKAWEAIVSGMFFSAGNSLESPCSTLNFSDNTLPIPAIGFHENSTGMLEFANDNDNLTCKRSRMTGHKDQLCNGGNDWNCLEKLICQISQLKEKPENPEVVQLHEMSTYSSTDNNAWLVDSFRGSAAPAENVNAPIGHIINEGLSDLLICNSDEQNSFVAAGGGASGGENGNGSCSGVNLDQEIMNYCNSLVNLVEDKASGSYVVLTDHHHDM